MHNKYNSSHSHLLVGIDSVPEGYDRAYRLAKECFTYDELSKLSGITHTRLRHWNRTRKFAWKTVLCENPDCGVPLNRVHGKRPTIGIKLCAGCKTVYLKSKPFRDQVNRRIKERAK